MAKARDTATDSLANVVEVVELARRTGLLAAERGTGSLLQEGEIYFVAGRPIYAAASHLRGREALAALGQWGACRFAFDPAAPRPIANILPATGANSGTFERGAESSRPTPSSLSGSGPGWGPPSTPPAESFPSVPVPATPVPARAAGSPSGSWSIGPTGSSLDSGPLARRPRRAPDVRDLMTVVTKHNLSRSHRTILLLADGSHNVLDLARLASKTIDDVIQLLAELEVRGLIYYYT